MWSAFDTFAHVARNVYDKADGDEKEVFRLPSFMNDMLEKGWIGSKAKAFIKKKEKRFMSLTQ